MLAYLRYPCHEVQKLHLFLVAMRPLYVCVCVGGGGGGDTKIGPDQTHLG